MLAFLYKSCRTLLKFKRFTELLRQVEHQAQEQDEGPSASRSGPVLLLYANVGSGHKRAAEAIQAALLLRGVAADKVKMLDAMELVPTGCRF